MVGLSVLRSGSLSNASSTDPAGRRWAIFLTQAQLDLNLWVFVVIWLGVFRAIMLLAFSRNLGPSATWGAILDCALTGARFDFTVATMWALPGVLATLATLLGLSGRFAGGLRQVVGRVFVVLSALLGAAAILFFAEYKDHFNHWVFGLVFDDAKAVLRTVWASLPVVPSLLGLGLGIVAPWLIVKALLAKPWVDGHRLAARVASWPRRTAVVLLLLSSAFAGLRGSLGTRPIQLKDAAVTGDLVLNKMVVNPYSALLYAVNSQLQLIRGSDLRVLWPSGDIREAARTAFPSQPSYDDLDALIERVAKGPPAERPRHIFLIIMESYDAWPFLERYRSLGLVEGVRGLAQDGILIPAFVSAGTGTMTSVGALITGLPEAGAVVNYQPASRQPFPTTAPAIFKQLGYRTRAFYAGYLSWQRFGDFCADQGFEEIYGGGDMVKGGLTREWGAEDDQLFDFVQEHVPAEPPSFNVILSAGYHRPFDQDVYGKGFPLHEVPEAIRPLWEGAVTLKALGHFWFADHCLGNFITRAEQRLPGSVFAATGDHWSRDFLNERPDAYEQSAVLMLWRGKGILPPVEDPARIAGSHLDIVPTLVELAAPAGFKYHAFGSNLFDPDRVQIGAGMPAILGPDFIIRSDSPETALALWDMQQRPPRPEELQALNRYRALCAVSWWRLTKGPTLAGTP